MCHNCELKAQPCLIFHCADGIMMLPSYYLKYWPSLDEVRPETGKTRFDEFLRVKCIDIQLAFLCTIMDVTNNNNSNIIGMFYPFLFKFAVNHNIPKLLSILTEYSSKNQKARLIMQERYSELIRRKRIRKGIAVGLGIVCLLGIILYRFV